MVKQIIRADAYKTRKYFHKNGESFLNVSEFFYDTIQGEGVNSGRPAAFLRLQHCTLSCQYCDTTEVWRYGSQYTFHELFDLIDSTMLIPKLLGGMHLVLTGGSPLLQQDALYDFIKAFYGTYQFKPYIEVENECVLMPSIVFADCVDCWNNSPKLLSSGILAGARYKPDVLLRMALYKNSWFKFVIQIPEEWKEIEDLYLKPGLIQKNQVILMPRGETPEELSKYRELTFNMATENNVIYSDRVHIVLFGKKIGV